MPAGSIYAKKPGRKTRSDKGKKRGAMKKVSKRGAYKKNVKNQMVKRRAPMVETKQRVHSDIAFINGYPAGAGLSAVNPLNWRYLGFNNDAFTNIPLRSWTRNTHGFNDYNCVGNSIFSKYLNFKFQLRFPRGEKVLLPLPSDPTQTYEVVNKMIQHPTKVFLVTGWITESMNYPIDNSPSPSLPAQSDADHEALDAYITQQLKPFFDDDEDKLQFRPKTTTNIKIDRYVNLTPKLNQAIGTQAVPTQHWRDPALAPAWTTDAMGSIPDIQKSWSNKTNRKIALTQGEDTSYPVDKQNLYPNNSWVPFAVIYNPDYEAQVIQNVADPAKPGQFLQIQLMEYRWNDVHYYSDS